MSDGRSAVEAIKEQSGFLAGTLAEELADDLPGFAKDTTQVLKFHGVYQQDDRDVRRDRARRGLGKDYVCMVRAGIPGGVLTGEQYLAMDRLADEVGNGTLRITTRQGVQYHFARKGDLKTLIGALNAQLVTTLAACGDVVRNVTACPVPAVDREHIGLQEVARDLSRHLKPRTNAYWQLWVDGERAVSALAPDSDDPDAVEPLYGPTYLPRKFKVGFAYPGDNCVDVLSNDIGIVPHLAFGRVDCFTLAVGGGLGMSHNNPDTYPRLADPLCAVAPAELVETVKAIVSIQRDFGDRADRRHARMKYLVQEWGVGRFRAELESRLGRAVAAPRSLSWEGTHDHLGWTDQGDGRWTLGVRVANGRVEDNGVPLRTGLRRVVERFGTGVRLTPRQDVLLTDVAATDRAEVEDVLRRHRVTPVEDLPLVARHAMACPALPTCGLAIAEAERVLPPVVDRLHGQLDALGLGGEPIHVRMTGCPNGCARPYSTEIGIVGRGKDHYTIYLGGDAEGSRLNTEYADRIPLDGIVAALMPVFEAFRDGRRDGEPFGAWCHRAGVERLGRRFAPDTRPRSRQREALAG